MTDLDLLLLGTGVTFIAAGGCYVFLRERFTSRRERALAIQRLRTERQQRRVDHAA